MNEPRKLLLAADLLKMASASFSKAPTPASLAQIEARRALFEAGADLQNDGIDLNVFFFHLEVPAHNSVINYVDVNVDTSKFSYEDICRKSVSHLLDNFPRVQVYFVTDKVDTLGFTHDRLSVLQISANGSEPMYERVYAMAGFVRSKLFARPTAFLDTDVFVGINPYRFFDRPFDVGVTIRPATPVKMPVNEGVILVNNKRPVAVERFFDSYIATYERLLRNMMVINYYSDIKRWRGGQLSLNVAALMHLDEQKKAEREEYAPVVIALPDSQWNFTFEYGRHYSSDELAKKVFFHMKGKWKYKSNIDYLLTFLDTRKNRGSASNVD